MSKFSGLFLKSQINFDKYKTDDNSTSNFFQVFILHYVGLSPILGLGKGPEARLELRSGSKFQVSTQTCTTQRLKI